MGPILVESSADIAATPSAARQLQERLNAEFTADAPTAYPEPEVERWSPLVSLAIIVGGSGTLWALILGALYLIAR